MVEHLFRRIEKMEIELNKEILKSQRGLRAWIQMLSIEVLGLSLRTIQP
jgi:hypothetical protein